MAGDAAADLDFSRALYEAYAAVPRTKRAEIVKGTLYVLPRPAPPHANTASALGFELFGPFQRGRGGPGGWWILDEPEIQFDPFEAVVPDIAGWRVERMPSLPETAYFTVVSDWVCEVLSPATAHLDRAVKLGLYAERGVKHAWIVDPIAKSLEVHAHEREGHFREVRVHSGDVRVRVPPFEAIEIELAALWSPPSPGPAPT